MMRLLPAALAAFIAATSAWGAAWGQSAWRPEKQVEIILPTAPGGGNDTVARLMQKALQEQKLVTAPILVLNKAGGNQTVSVTKNDVTAPSLRGAELTKYLDAQYKHTHGVLVELGLAK